MTNTPLSSIGIFCGSSPGTRPEYVQAAKAVGKALAERDIKLIYGGGSKGMMGAVADGALEAGGYVIGVIPGMLVEQELAHQGAQEMRVVETMLERKAIMAELSDAFIIMPGGLGTLDELFEMLTWTQLKLQDKVCGVLNVSGFFDDLLRWADRAVEDGYVKAKSRRLIIEGREIDALLEQISEFKFGQ